MQTIGTLSRLCGLVPTVPMGLTDACRLVARGAGVPVTPADVRQRLQSMASTVEVRERPRCHPYHPETPERVGRTAVRPEGLHGRRRVGHREARLPVEPRTPRGRARRGHQGVHARRQPGARGDAGDRRAGAAPPEDPRAATYEEREASMIEIELRRRFFAEELEAVCKLRTACARSMHSRGCRAISFFHPVRGRCCRMAARAT
jgi:hypothetical protein